MNYFEKQSLKKINIRNVDQYDVIIIGTGLAGLAAASRLIDESRTIKIAMITAGKGATSYISGLNAVIYPNPWGDSNRQYIQDMLESGCYINDQKLVEVMCQEAPRCIKLLQKWGICFAARNNQLLRRHTSGSTYPRTLCQTSDLLGNQIITKLSNRLLSRGVKIFYKTICTRLLLKKGEVYGVLVSPTFEDNYQFIIYAPVVIVAWGGIGNLFPESTYPRDIDGRTLAMAFESGARLIDLEFVEFEPLVFIWPPVIKNKLCPTSILGDGAYLLNRDHKRFLLSIRQQGEAGASKTMLNQAIWKELSEGRGSSHKGVYVDLRHISQKTLKAYPWFFERMKMAGLDPTNDLLEVAPLAHSHSGGMAVNENYQTNIYGLFAIGEAMGGIHGACRIAGNAATQALVSGVLGAEGVLGIRFKYLSCIDSELKYLPRNNYIYNKIIPRIKDIIGQILGAQRDGATLKEGIERLWSILTSKKILKDEFIRQTALSGLLIAQSSLLRKESRGTHYRRDYPGSIKNWQCSICIYSSNEGEVKWEKIPRKLMGRTN